MSALVGAALIAGAAGLMGSGMNAASQNSANQQNMEIAQMNNEWSEKMLDKQIAYNREAWDKSVEYNDKTWLRDAEYNSASAQAQRYKDANLNPALMMGSGTAGTATSASAPSANSIGLPSPSSATVQPVNYSGFSDNISNVIQHLMSIEKQENDISNANKMTDAQVAEARARIALMQEQQRGELFKNNMNEITKDLDLAIRNEDYLQAVQKRDNDALDNKLKKQQIVYNDMINKNLPERLSMELAVMASQRDLNKYNTQSEAGKMIETMKKRGYKLSKSDEKAILDAFKDQAIYGFDSWPGAISRTVNAGKRIINGFFNN